MTSGAGNRSSDVAPAAEVRDKPGAGVDCQNPWPGLTPFTENLSAFFFGRDQEAAELFRLVRRETLTLLFGQSGLGKSSLVQAGLSPRLRQANFIPVNLRLDHAVNAPPLIEQIKSGLRQMIASGQVDAPPPAADQTLWEYFHSKDVDFWTSKHHLATPVLIFDQFEEIFTLGRASNEARVRGEAFLNQLGDLIENRIPETLKRKLDEGSVEPNRFSFGDASCKVLITFREDFLPDLEGLRQQIRGVMQNRMRMVRMNGMQALDVVEKGGADVVEAGVGPLIVQFVAAAGAEGAQSARDLGEMEVEPALLSVICRELNNKRIALGQARITADLLAGSRREILSDFYQRSIQDLPESARIFVEDRLLTPSGIRENIALENALLEPGISRELIERLVARRLLRVEDRFGVSRVELTHDILAQPIRASRDTRQQRLALEKAVGRERAAHDRLAQIRRRVALYVALAGVLVSVPLTAIALRQKSAAMHALEEARRESARARVNGQLAAKNGQEAAANLKLARERLADYYALRIQGALQETPPQPLVAELLLQQAQRGSTFQHADLIRLLLPSAPFVADRLIPVNIAVDRLLYSPDGTILAATGGGKIRFINASTGAPLPQRDFDDAVGAAQLKFVVFHPNQRLLAVRARGPHGEDEVLRWDCSKNAEVRPRLLLKWPEAAGPANESATAPLAAGGSGGGAAQTPSQWRPAASGGGSADSLTTPLMYSSDGTAFLAASESGDLAFFPADARSSTPETSPATQPAVGSAVEPTKFLSNVVIGARFRRTKPREGEIGVGGKRVASGRERQSSGFAPNSLGYIKCGQIIMAADGGHLLFLDSTSLDILEEQSLDGASERQSGSWTAGAGARMATGADGHSFCTWPAGDGNENACQLQKIGIWKYGVNLDPKVITLPSLPLSAAYSGDGKFVALGLRGGGIEVCRANQRRPVQLLHQPGAIVAVGFRPDSLELASASADAGIQLWRMSDREKNPVQGGASDMGNAIAVSADGAVLATLHRRSKTDRDIHLLSTSTGDLLDTLSLPIGQITDIAVRQDLHVLVALLTTNGLELHDLKSGATLWKIPGAKGGVDAVRFSDDGKRIAIRTPRHAITVFDAATFAQISATQPDAKSALLAEAPRAEDPRESTVDCTPTGMAFAHGGAQLADYFAGLGGIRVIDVQSGKVAGRAFDVPASASIVSLEYSGDNSELICGDLAGNLLVLDAGSGRRIIQVPHASAAINKISVNRRDSILVQDGPAGGLVFVQSPSGTEDDLQRDSGLALDANLDVVTIPWAERRKALENLSIAPISADRIAFWSAFWKWDWAMVLREYDLAAPDRKGLEAAYGPTAEFLAAHPRIGPVAREVLYLREELQRQQPLVANPTSEQINARITVARDVPLDSTRIVLLDEVLHVLPAGSPRRAEVAALLACTIARQLEFLRYPASAQNEKARQEERALALLSEAVKLGYDDYDFIRRSFGNLVQKPGFPPEALADADLIRLGYDAINRGSPDAALAYFKAAEARGLNTYDTWWGQGLALKDASKFKESIECFRRAILLARDPQHLSNAYGAIAAATANIWPPKLDDALANARHAVELAAQNPYVLANRGWVYFKRHAYSEALADYNSAVSLSPSTVSFLNERSIVLLTIGDVAAARADLERVIIRKNNDAAACLEASNVISQYGRMSDALVYYKKGMEAVQHRRPPVAPETLSGYWKQGIEIDLFFGSYRAAHVALDRFKQSAPRNAWYFTQSGVLAASEGYPEKALEAFNRAVDLAKEADPRLLARRGQVKLRLNDPVGAKADFESAMAADSYATFNMIVASLDAICDLGLQDVAAKRLEAAISMVPPDPRYLLALGELNLRFGREADANHYFNLAANCEIVGHQPAIEEARGIARAYIGRFQLGRADVTSAANFEPQAPRALYGAAAIWALTAAQTAQPATQPSPIAGTPGRIPALFLAVASAAGENSDGYGLQHDWRLRALRDDPDFKALVAAQNEPDDHPLRYVLRAKIQLRLNQRWKAANQGTQEIVEDYSSYAIKELVKAIERGQTLAALGSDPDFESLRPLPAFQQLLHPRASTPSTSPG